MASELFDPMFEVALKVAKSGLKKKPKIAPPPKVAPIVRFTKVPAKAKDTLLEVLDSDEEFRTRVAKAADERKVGRIGMAYLERGDGWREFVDEMVAVADEPVIESTGTITKLERALAEAKESAAQARAERDQLRKERDELADELKAAQSRHDGLQADLDQQQRDMSGLTEQRGQAVSELKHTEEVLARHVAERKRLEALVETMTAAQLRTVAVGGGVTDDDVRREVESMEALMSDLATRLDALKAAATPEVVGVERRTPLPVPFGLLDDSAEYADYLLGVPSMLVIIDGYNVTKQTHGDWELVAQRDWLVTGMANLSAKGTLRVDVVFDGADVGTVPSSGRGGVTVRFTPEGIEADDEIIATVGSLDPAQPVTVVSSDKRVREGARKNGANVLYSEQLLAFL